MAMAMISVNLSNTVALKIFEVKHKVAAWRDLYGIDGVDLDIEVVMIVFF